ncbi:hypothetical protein D1872_306360 [compost metagenome]
MFMRIGEECQQSASGLLHLASVCFREQCAQFFLCHRQRAQRLAQCRTQRHCWQCSGSAKAFQDPVAFALVFLPCLLHDVLILQRLDRLGMIRLEQPVKYKTRFAVQCRFARL